MSQHAGADSPRRPLLLYITDAEGLGGAEGYLETLLRHADRARYRVALALPPRAATRPLVARAQALGVAVVPLDSVHRDGIDGRSLARALRLLRHLRPAVVHAVLNGPRRCAETLLAAWLLRVPCRLATFQLVTPIPQFGGLNNAARALNRSLQFRMLHAGVAVSRGNARLLVEQYGFPAGNLAIIPNGVDLARFAPQADNGALRAAWHVPRGAALIGVVGRLGSQKGQRVLLQALAAVWARFPEVHVALVGTGELEAELRALAVHLDHGGRIHFAGQIERAHMPQVLAALDVFVLPSLYEGLPFAVVEAMAAAKPIVATKVDGTVEAIHAGVDGLLVAPGDHGALATALVQLLDDRVLCTRLGEAARAAALTRFDEAAMLRATFALYL